ncbi:HD domain-containing protein [Paenibacillus campi]|uniref:HD domain-containing protein n=1 Tax=Paenibacillus campi TaxID=3106031 RepID=UPI002AFDE82E|nr:HD domain-containing protein [Paenibacillus sp. SGZ-1014]
MTNNHHTEMATGSLSAAASDEQTPQASPTLQPLLPAEPLSATINEHTDTDTAIPAAPIAEIHTDLPLAQQQILAATYAFVKQELGGETSGHDWWHIHRVVQMARRLALAEGADDYICSMAALLHDIADEKLNPSKEVGMQRVADWLERQKVEPEERAHITFIIANMSYNGGNNPPLPSIEGKVVQDADRLDAIGAIAIARTFVYAGHVGDMMYDPDLPVRQQMTAAEYRTGRSTAINHFHEKLLKLKHRLNTQSARQIAEDRHRYMEEYVQRFYQEWEGR